MNGSTFLMKTIRCLSLTLVALAFTVSRGIAALLIETATFAPNVLIPDGSIVGVADTRTFNSAISTITEVRLTLEIAGANAFNGDYYAYLSHSSGFAVLLNRAGKTSGNPFGYADSGFLVTFDDTPGSPDIHGYQALVNPLGGALTGTWGSDGRNVDPATALDTSLRSATLAAFDGLDPNGAWTLFVADLSPLGEGRLLNWQLEVTGATAVPEPGTALGAVACVGTLFIRRRRRCS